MRQIKDQKSESESTQLSWNKFTRDIQSFSNSNSWSLSWEPFQHVHIRMNSSLLQELLPLLPNSKSMPTDINNAAIHWRVKNIPRISGILLWLFDRHRVTLCLCHSSRDTTPTSHSSASPVTKNKSDWNRPAGSVRTHLSYLWCTDVKPATRWHDVRPRRQRPCFSVTPDDESSKTQHLHSRLGRGRPATVGSAGGRVIRSRSEPVQGSGERYKFSKMSKTPQKKNTWERDRLLGDDLQLLSMHDSSRLWENLLLIFSIKYTEFSLSFCLSLCLSVCADEAAGKSKDLSAWFNLFADLDPLANPDTVGQTEAEHGLHNHA